MMDAGTVAGSSVTLPYCTSTSMSQNGGSIAGCADGDTFFGKSVTAEDGSVTAEDGSLWLSNESNRLFLPLTHPQTKDPMFERVCWECANGNVMGRKTPNISDVSETRRKTGETISALPVSEHPGWLMEAGSKLYFPKNHPRTGVFL